MSDGDVLLLKLALGTLIVPTIAYFAVRQTRGGQRPIAAKVSAWLCMWIGQLSFAMAFAAYIAFYFAVAWWQARAYPAFAICGVALVALSLHLLLQAIRVFKLGTLALGQGTDDAVSAVARKLRTHGGIASVLVIGHWVVLFSGIDLPGGWEVLAYFAFVTIPVTLTALLVLIIGVAMAGPPWRQPIV